VKKSSLILSIFFLLFIQSCSSQKRPLQNGELPQNLAETKIIPTPDNLTGVLFGILRSDNGEPIQDGIFLSRNISYENPDVPPTISFSFQNSPRAIVDPTDGFFYFSKIEPAENYVLTILNGPSEVIVVEDDAGGLPITISIQAGETIDLGFLTVELP
jgi:hypothetical protein